MRWLIDANIVLDVLSNRQPFVEDSSKIWKLCETGQAEGYISALTFANIVYILSKELDAEGIEKVLNSMKLIFSIAELTEKDLISAAQLRWNDYEDAIQAVTAKRINADVIVTRNVKDYKRSTVFAFSPSEMLSRM